MDQTHESSRSKSLRFHVPEVLWLALIVALGLGWLLELRWHHQTYASLSSQLANIGTLQQALAVAESRPIVGAIASVDKEQDLAVITLGAIDGLEPGNELDAYRHVSDGQSKEVWLTGRFRIVNVDGHVSVGKAIYLVERNAAQQGDLVEFYRKPSVGR